MILLRREEILVQFLIRSDAVPSSCSSSSSSSSSYWIYHVNLVLQVICYLGALLVLFDMYILS